MICFAAVAFQLASTVVTINGTSGADTIVVGDHWHVNSLLQWVNLGPAKYVNGTFTALTVSAGDEIDINGGDGADFIEIPNATDGNYRPPRNNTDEMRPMTSVSPGFFRIDGGAGQDEIHGSDLADEIYGGADSDLIYGNGGNDFILGGEQGSSDCDSTSMPEGQDQCFGNSVGSNVRVFCDMSVTNATYCGCDSCSSCINVCTGT